MEQQLIEAAKHGSTEDVRLLLHHGANLNYRDGSRKTALIWASKNGHLETVRVILSNLTASNASSVSYSSDSGWSPLHYAASSGNVLLTNLLLQRGARAMAKNCTGETSLHLAAKNGHTDTVRVLLEKGASNVYDKTKDGWTPLHYSAANGYITVSRLLMDKGGSDVLFSTDIRGNSPLNIAKNGPTANALRKHKEQMDRLSRRDVHTQDKLESLSLLKTEFEEMLQRKVAKQKADIMATVDKKQDVSKQKIESIVQQQQTKLGQLQRKVTQLEARRHDPPPNVLKEQQEQAAEIQALQSENGQLKTENSSLKAQVARLQEALAQCQGRPLQQHQQHEVEILEAKNIALRELVTRYKCQEEEQQKATLAALRETVAKEIASMQESFSSFNKQ